MGSGELQPWNNPDEHNGEPKDTEEAVPLKKEGVVVNQ